MPIWNSILKHGNHLQVHLLTACTRSKIPWWLSNHALDLRFLKKQTVLKMSFHVTNCFCSQSLSPIQTNNKFWVMQFLDSYVKSFHRSSPRNNYVLYRSAAKSKLDTYITYIQTTCRTYSFVIYKNTDKQELKTISLSLWAETGFKSILKQEN